MGTVFVPPPSVKSTRAAQLSTAACAAALFGAENAHADEIGDAAAKLSKAAYPFMKEVPWNSYLYATTPGSKDAVAWAKAVGKMIDMGAAMDTKLLKAGADAHHAAIGGLPASGVCSEAQLTAINAAIGRMIASVPESKTMGVYDSVSALVDSQVPAYLMSTEGSGCEECICCTGGLRQCCEGEPYHAIHPCIPSVRWLDRRGCWQALGCSVPIHQGCGLDI